jgi:hypothetical protein
VQPDSIVISRAIGGTVSGNTMNGVDRDFVKLESDQNFVVANNTIATGRIGYPAIQISPWYTRHDLHSMNIRVTGNHILVLASLTVSKSTRTTRLRRSRRTSKSITTRSPLRPRAGRTVPVRGTCCSACRLTATQGSTRSPFTTTPITGTTSYAIYVWVGGTGLSFQNNMHGESALSNLSVPGAFSCCTYTRN